MTTIAATAAGIGSAGGITAFVATKLRLKRRRTNTPESDVPESRTPDARDREDVATWDSTKK
jgi:hypothetical protein